MDRTGFAALGERLPKQLVSRLRALSPAERQNLEEIRIYAGRNAELVIGGKCAELPERIDMDELLCALSAQALYSCERQMALGYIPLPGGHRAGVCGRMCREEDGTWRMAQVSSVCIRIGRHVEGASKSLRPYLLDAEGKARRVLVLGAPGCGKTTVLRDAALWMAERGLFVAAADEREELFGGEIHQNGLRMHVLGGMDKALALPMLIRTMGSQVIVTDEIGKDEDTQAVLDALRCGIGLLVSAHAGSMEEAMRRPAIRALWEQRAFDGYALLGRRSRVISVYDHEGKRWEADVLGQLGSGNDGDDWRQRGRISAL